MICQCSLIKGTNLMRSYLFVSSNILTGCSSNTRPSMAAKGPVKRAWSGSEMYCLSYEVRNTLCTCFSYIHRPSWQAIGLEVSAYCITA